MCVHQSIACTCTRVIIGGYLKQPQRSFRLHMKLLCVLSSGNQSMQKKRHEHASMHYIHHDTMKKLLDKRTTHLPGAYTGNVPQWHTGPLACTSPNISATTTYGGVLLAASASRAMLSRHQLSSRSQLVETLYTTSNRPRSILHIV